MALLQVVFLLGCLLVKEHLAAPGDFGTTYIRWGRSDCPKDSSELVYAGYAAGSHYSHAGAAVNFLCLTKVPEWNNNKFFQGSTGGLLYGAEFQSQANSNLNGQDVSCAVCRAKFGTTLMIPGRNKCYPGWTEAYNGDLGAGYYNHNAGTEYICVDQKAEVFGKKATNYGKLIYPVKAQCGALHCEDKKYEAMCMACVVCLK